MSVSLHTRSCFHWTAASTHSPQFLKGDFSKGKKKVLCEGLTLPLISHTEAVWQKHQEQQKSTLDFTEPPSFTPASLNKEQEREPTPLFGASEKYSCGTQRIASVFAADRTPSYLYSLSPKSLQLKKMPMVDFWSYSAMASSPLFHIPLVTLSAEREHIKSTRGAL